MTPHLRTNFWAKNLRCVYLLCSLTKQGQKTLTILQFKLIASKEFIYLTKFQAVHITTWTSEPYKYSLTFVATLTAKQ